MIKAVFILVFSINGYPANADLKFPTLQQCEAAKSQIHSTFYHPGRSVEAVCIETQVPAKKLKCKIGNNFSYRPPRPGHHSGSGAMENYPFPETIECTEE